MIIARLIFFGLLYLTIGCYIDDIASHGRKEEDEVSKLGQSICIVVIWPILLLMAIHSVFKNKKRGLR